MINWKVRIKNKMFWVTMVPLIFLLARRVLAIFGIDFDFDALQAQILDVVEVAFAILAALGIVTDMTTQGVSDSTRALSYDEPYPKEQ